MKKNKILLLFIPLLWGCSIQNRLPEDYYSGDIVYAKADKVAMIVKDYNPKTQEFRLEVDTTQNRYVQNWTFNLREEFFYK